VKYRTEFTAAARAEIRELPKDVAVRILAKLAELECEPTGFKTTALVSAPEFRRLRVGDYRVIYRVEGDQLVVLVVRVGHRREVYER
jgi:mRNA interferase RelE/StbE